MAITDRLPNLKPEQATLYRAALSVGTQETQLIWTRYTGFVIMNGFIVNSLGDGKHWDVTAIVFLIGVIALVLNSVWHVLNYVGWQNQILWYRQAAGLFEGETGLITDFFRNEPLNTTDWIYWLAQTIPLLFSGIGLACLWRSSVLFGNTSQCSWGIATTVWLVAVLAVVLVEYRGIAKDRPA